MAQPRQALILIHGIGEQRPMETLRGFVDAILSQPQKAQTSNTYYSKPDILPDRFELRRLVSTGGRTVKTDFYEFYWAHLMPTATWGRLVSWYSVLMRRWPSEIPRQVMPIYVISWVIVAAIVGSGLFEAGRFLIGYPIASSPLGKVPWLIIAALGFLSVTMRSYIGDSAVYLSPSPPNIDARQKIRAAGLALLDEIVASERYDRIIVVGHSLGSVIGYDVLSFAWQRHNTRLRKKISIEWKNPAFPPRKTGKVRNAEDIAKNIRERSELSDERTVTDAKRWQAATRSVQQELCDNNEKWIVTDFVTLGSPLAHGAMLLAKDRDDFNRRVRERELPQCPPVPEQNGKFSFDYQGKDADGDVQEAVVLHHAALFAAVRWTNLFFRCRFVVKGDLAAGPVAPIFGPGIRDIEVKTHTRNGLLSHTLYWRHNSADTNLNTSPVYQLNDAIDLDRTRGFAVSNFPIAKRRVATIGTPPSPESQSEPEIS